MAYYQRATRLDPADAQTWNDYACAAMDAGRTGEAKAAFEQAVRTGRREPTTRARATGPRWGWATLRWRRAACRTPCGSTRPRRPIAEPIAKADPGNAGWQRDLSVSHDRIGDVLVARATCRRRWQAYRASLAIESAWPRPTPAMPAGSATSRCRTNKIGDVLVAQGNLPAALEAYQASLAISERLAKADPGNAGWQRDLSVSHDKIGDVLVAQGNLPAALESFRATLAIGERLAKADPGNAGWQRDLSVSHDKIGDVLLAQGNLPAALDAFRASSPSASGSPRPTPAMPDGSATSRSRMTRSATCLSTGQPAGGAGCLPGLPRHQRAPGQGRPRQCRMAARPLVSHRQDRRRASELGQLPGGAGRLPSLPRHQRAPGQGRPRQCRMAARPLRLT